MRRTSSISSASIDSRPAVSTMSTSRPSRTASSRPFLATVTGSDGFAEDRDPCLTAQHPELLDGGRPLQVGADEERVASLPPLVPEGQLAGRGGLAGALQTGQQNHGRRPRRVGQPERIAAQDVSQLVVDDLHDLLARSQALREVHPDELLADPRDEIPDDPQVDVRLQQGQPDLPQRLVDVGLAQPAPSAQPAEDRVEAVGQALEHRAGGTSDMGRFSLDDPLRLACLARKSSAFAQAMG